MPSIFLSHTSIDKPFVEKLAKDLKRIGINVWYDKWDIKVGESITWKIENGIRENEYLGIVLSPEALNSEWVKNELSSAWVKQMQTKKVVILPIYYRDCEIPYFLADRKYADFRNDYILGFEELISVLGVKNLGIISEDNWRRYIKVKRSNWQYYRKLEFEKLVTVLIDRAIEYNWSSWVGGKGNYAITFYAFINSECKQSVSIRLDNKVYAYFGSLKYDWNPNHLNRSDYDIYIGNTINECEEFLWRKMEDFKRKYGNPLQKAEHIVSRFINTDEGIELASKVIKELRWYKGNKL